VIGLGEWEIRRANSGFMVTCWHKPLPETAPFYPVQAEVQLYALNRKFTLFSAYLIKAEDTAAD
jgi:hypothetical protein